MVICQDIQVDLDEMGNGTIEPSDLLFVYPEYLVYDANMSGWGPAGACGGRRKGSTTDLESFTWEDQLSSLAGVTSIEIEISMQWSETSNVYPYSLNGDVLGSEFGVGPGGCWIQVKTIELDLSSYNVGGTNTFTWDLPADDHALIMNSAWGDAFARVVIHGDSPGLSDNCSDVGSINLTASTTTFSCSEVGTQEVTLEATDANGNTSNCTSIVTVEDNIPPVVICQDIQVDLDEMGNGTIEPSDLLFVYPEYLVYDANMSGWGPAGACGGRRKGSTTDLESFTWEDQLSSLAGVTSIEIEISMQWSETSNVYPYSLNGDVLGSEFGVGPGGCWIQVKTIELDLSSYNVGGTNTFTWDLPADDHALIMNSAWGDAFARVVIHGDSPGLSDNCSDVGSINLTASTTTFSCSEVGTQEVTLEATDANGNTSSCTSIVTVEDNIPPVVICRGHSGGSG